MVNKELVILYEDEHILVVNKPAGLVVHPDGRTEEDSVSRWFSLKYPESKDVGEPIELANGETIERPGVVHRIDRETSGALVLAKTAEAHAHLKNQFMEREVEKRYHVFVHGLLKDDHGSISLPIGKSASDFRKWSAERGAKGEKREALTYYRVIKRLASPMGEGEETKVTFLEARPKTGRTHQIRVHFLALQHPVVADTLYARSKPKLLGFERLALHAFGISFLSLDGEKIEVEAPYPEDFKQAIDKLV